MRCSPSQRALSPAKYSFNIVSMCKPKRDPCGALRLGFACSAKGFDPQNFDFAQDDTLGVLLCGYIYTNFVPTRLILTYPFPTRKRRYCLDSVFCIALLFVRTHFKSGMPKAIAPTGRWRSLQARAGSRARQVVSLIP